MKKQVILICALIFLPVSAFANTAYVPIAVNAASGAFSACSCYYMTNISDVNEDVTFSLFNTDGTSYTGTIDYPIYISAIGQQFSLGPHQTASFCLPNTSPSFSFGGSGQIDVVAADGVGRSSLMVAQGNYLTFRSNITASSSAIIINGGKPF